METLRYVVLANGLLVVTGLAYYVLLRRETFFGLNRAMLWVGLVASLLLPALELPDWRPERVRVTMQRTAQRVVPKLQPILPTPAPDVTITFPNQRTYRAFTDAPTQHPWTWWQWLGAVYVAVLAGGLVRFAVRLRSICQLIRQSAQEPYNDFVLVRNESITSPFSFFQYVVLNPDRYAPDELEQILRHERVHVRAWHSVDMLAAELVCVILWFNPAVYLFRHLLHQTLEFAVDRAVLAEGIDRRAYQLNLLKVSLAGGPFTFTNSFSKSFLKLRINMINQPNSDRATWVKYPLLLLATLTVAALFARSDKQTLSINQPQPIVRAVTVAVDNEVKTKKFNAEKPVDKVVAVTAQNQASLPNPVRISPSRYMQYEGDKLYWVVTPKTSFDDLAVMKQEFERHGYKMQIQALKYDPLFYYITDIKVTIIRPTVGISDFEETGVDGKPIRSHGGYNGINESISVAAVGTYPFNKSFVQLPKRMEQLVRDEDLSVAKFIRDNRLSYLVATGEKISRQYAPTSTHFKLNSLLARPELVTKYGITLAADSTYTLSDAHFPVFINNERITNEGLIRIDSKRFGTLISSEEYGKNGQIGAVKALLFYTKEP